MSDFKITFLSWNVNGLGSDRFSEFLQSIEFHNFPKIICLQETHSKNADTIRNWSIGLSQYHCFFNHGDGSNRGTAILIHKSLPFKLLLEIQDWEEGRFTIIKGKLHNSLVTIVSVYAPIPDSDKPWFFEKILACNLEGVKFIMGDFNTVPNPELDRARKTNKVRCFLDFIEFTDTVDSWRLLHPSTRGYTYGNTSRIDLILLSSHFKQFLNHANIGPKYFSDHRLITATVTFGREIFGRDFKKIRPTTIASPDYDQVFHFVWNRSLSYFRNELYFKLKNGTFIGNPQQFVESCKDGFNYTHEFVLNNITLGADWWDTFKAEILHYSLEFQRKNFSDKKQQFIRLQRDFYRLPEGSSCKKEVEDQLFLLLKGITKEFNFQKEKDKRLTHERFSAGFFKQAYQDRKISYFSEFQGFDNEILTSHTDIHDHLLLRYFYLYQSEPLQMEHLDFFRKYIPKIRVKENTAPFSYSEAQEVFKNMKSGTCPGPDGIPCEFYKKYFIYFGHFYVKMLNNCLRDGIVPNSWKTAILKVIPKVPDQIPSFDTLRPLTLGNVDCKNEAGMLVKRMTVVTDEVIHKLQTGGLPHRQIQDSVFLIHLLINLYKENNWSGYIGALDNYKAFDKLIRSFLWIVIEEMGFDQWTIQAIKNMYQDTSARIIINGFLSAPFSIESGVKQGCPLSPLLFAIAMEPLARSILDDPMYIGFGFRIPGNKEIRLVQHLDDMTLFSANAHSFISFMNRIQMFNTLSGGEINYSKSFLIRLDTTNGILSSDGPKLCNIPVLGNEESRKILGIFFGNNVPKYVERNWVIATAKCKEVLKLWRICFSSDGFTSIMGRALVVHVMVHSRLIYLMQVLQFYSEEINTINRAVHCFLWAGKKHIPKISLPVLEAPLNLGGIGIKPLDLRAVSLRFKYIKNFFDREGDNWMSQKSPVQAIMCYFLDLSVSFMAPHMSRSQILPLTLASKYYRPGLIQFIKPLPKLFDILFWDIERAIKVLGSAQNFEFWNQNSYLEKLMERRTLQLREGTVNKAHISKFHFPANTEEIIWKNILLKLLEPKLKAFAYKLAHDCLPTKYNIWKIMRHFSGSTCNPWCQYCKLVFSKYIACTAKHIFMDCPIAHTTWSIIGKVLVHYVVTEEFIFFHLGLDKFDSFVVTEIQWALWRVNNFNNYEVSDNDHTSLWTHQNVFQILKKRLNFFSSIDLHVSSNKVYRKNWTKINNIIGFVFDTG